MGWVVGLGEGSWGVVHLMVDELDWEAPFPETPAGQVVVHNVADRLFECVGRGNLRPNLVHSHSRSLDGLVWKFELQKGRRFHNGEEIASDDVLFTLLQDMFNPRSTALLRDWVAGEVDSPMGECRGLRKTSRSRFEVHLRRPCPDFLERLSREELSVRCRKAALEGRRVFSGPYAVSEAREDLLVLRLQTDHPEADSGCAEEVQIHLQPLSQGDFSPRQSCAASLVSGFHIESDVPTASPTNRMVFPNVGAAGFLVFRKGTPRLAALKAAFHGALSRKRATAGFLQVRTANSIYPAGSQFYSPVDARGRLHFASTEESGDAVAPAILSVGDREWVERVRRLLDDDSALGEMVSLQARVEGESDGEFVKMTLNEAWVESELRRTFLSPATLRGFPAAPFLKQMERAAQESNPQARASQLRVLLRDLVADAGLVPLWFAPTVLFLSDDLDYARVESAGWPLRFSSFRKLQVVTREDVRAARLEAIARTTQMFAHDVRKPFSMLKMALETLEGCSDPRETLDIVRRLAPEVQRAMASVDGMIADIMEIGSDAPPVRESVCPESIVEATLLEMFRIHRECQIGFTFDFQHSHMLMVDSLKVARVISNVVGNAIQAMKRRGEIWFRTREVYENGLLFVEFCIGNSNSRIAEEDLDRVFEAFFTRGKKGGTGLGLAIAEKIVSAHGGRIRAHSKGEAGVEFLFTLPAAPQLKCRPGMRKLPRSSQELERSQVPAASQAAPGTEIQLNEPALISDVVRGVKTAGRRVRLLCIDDESLYRNAIRALVDSNAQVAALVDAHMSKSSEGALNLCRNTAFDCIICDVDLGVDSMDGFELVQRLREQGVRAHICIHSNRSLPQDFKTAIDAGANAFLPKPMSRAHLLRLIAEAARVLMAPSRRGARPVPEVALVEDSSLVRAFWKRKLTGVSLHMFRSPAELWQRLEVEPRFLERLACVVTDQIFEDVSGDTGLELAARLRPMVKCPIFLSSEARFSPAQWEGVVDGLLEKDPLAWVELEQRIASVGLSRGRSEGRSEES